MRAFLLVVIALLGWLGAESRASACTCLPPDMGRSYNNADHVMHVRIQFALGESSTARTYVARLVENDFKGCLDAGQWVVIQTGANGATCGLPMSAGQELLLHGTRRGMYGGLPRLQVGSCDPNGEWKALSKEHRTFLDTRFVKCRSECADGSEPVQCFADPCSVSSCDVEGATCRASYCGGCNAEWYDRSGTTVCSEAGACDYEAPGRRYVARSPAECQLVRFACQPGEQMFSNDCGCGCEKKVRPAPVAPCRIGGCSSQLCVGPGQPDITTCEWREAYACYRDAQCEPQPSGGCGWTQTPELSACLESAR